MNISDFTIKVLNEAGWYEGRAIDTKEIEENLKQLGYNVFPSVQCFIKEFGNLEVKDTINDEFHSTNIKFTSYDKFGSFKNEENYAKEKLVPVGMINDNNLILFVSETGKIYCNIGKLGDTAMEAWEMLLNAGRIELWD